MAGTLLLPAGRVHAPAVEAPAQTGAEGRPQLVHKRRIPGWMLVFLTVLFAVVAGAVGGGITGSLVSDAQPEVVLTRTSVSAGDFTAEPGLEPLPALVAQVKRSVVSIEVLARTATGVRGQTIAVESYGTGFVLTSGGLIATAAHVVEDAVMIAVSMPDGSITSGTVVGSDPVADVAIIHVNRENLVPSVLGNSSALRAGDVVLVVGNALALGTSPSATLGIVSATDRTISTGDGMTHSGLLQVDAHINPGNSGGPLVNGAGEVVGLVNSSISRSFGSGIGFAIPIETVAPILVALANADH